MTDRTCRASPPASTSTREPCTGPRTSSGARASSAAKSCRATPRDASAGTGTGSSTEPDASCSTQHAHRRARHDYPYRGARQAFPPRAAKMPPAHAGYSSRLPGSPTNPALVGGVIAAALSSSVFAGKSSPLPGSPTKSTGVPDKRSRRGGIRSGRRAATNACKSLENGRFRDRAAARRGRTGVPDKKYRGSRQKARRPPPRSTAGLAS